MRSTPPPGISPEVKQPLSTDQPALEIHDLWFSYPDRPGILQGVNLRVAAGERVGVIGPNGAGKTTCFLSICGVLNPTRGEIRVFGTPVISGQFQPEIGLVFQNPDDQLFSATVWDDVAFGPENMGLSRSDVQVQVEQALRLTGTQHLASRPPHHLSTGEKRMVAIAGILAMDPHIVIYDEPSASLDIAARRVLIEFMQQSSETILVSSHDLEFILEVCSRVILLDQGEIVADGKTKEILGNEDLMQAHKLEKPHSLSHSPSQEA